MKTLIFNGSPRKKGDCSSVLKKITDHLDGAYKIVNSYFDNIKPCIDCHYCWTKSGCSLEDKMQSIYDYIQDCDNIIIVSPIYFSELTGSLLSVMSRLQTYYCARMFRGENPILKSKQGFIVLVGGGDGGMEKAISTAKILLKQMNCDLISEPVIYHNTNIKPACEDSSFMERVKWVGESCSKGLK